MRLCKIQRSGIAGGSTLHLIFFISGLLVILAIGGALALRLIHTPALDLSGDASRQTPAMPEIATGSNLDSPVVTVATKNPTAAPVPSTEPADGDSLDRQLDLLLAEMTQNQEVAMPSPSLPEDPVLVALRSSFQFSCAAEAYPVDPAVELIVLADQRPVALRADLRQTAPLPEGCEVTGKQVLWSADHGSLVPAVSLPGSMAGSTATLHPGDGFEMIILRAELQLDISRTGANGEARSDSLRLEAVRHLLPPYSSSHMAGGLLDGYRIGEYPDPANPVQMAQFDVKSDWFDKYPERYQIPNFYYKVTAQTRDMLIAPNQTLGMHAIDFPWKSLGMPQYIALDMHLVQKLEDLIVLMRADGFVITRFVPIYGFRPPAFNLGTISSQSGTTLKEPFSMHQYGRAIDLIIDEDGDHVLDDLNGDGVSDIYDAAVIMHYVNILDRRYREEGRMEMVGGAGLYTHNDFVEREQYLGLQSAYIHVDTRGFLTDGGTLVRWPARWPNGDVIEFGKI